MANRSGILIIRQLWHRMVLQLSLFFLISCTAFAQEIHREIESLGLVDIETIDPTIVVDLMYGREDNFVGEDMYGELSKAYMLPHFAEKMKQAQRQLKEDKGEEYSLIIYDAARPLSIQSLMYEAVKGTPNQVYVASPCNGGGRHNYGAAVDLSIINTETGEVLDMGSPVDHFGIESHVGNEQELVRKGLITQEAAENRAYLMRLMSSVGLRNIRKEWWHFQERNSIGYIRKTYKLLDF